MELILKITEACSFACTFCSSSNISSENTKILDIQKVFDFLIRFPETKSLIINGGDPLMVKPQYYWKIIEYLDEHNLSTNLSFTTNLWAFYKKPKMWEELFKHERIGVTTSFNYGDTRRITTDRIFTETDFWRVSDLFLLRIGYRPDFISVITKENEDTALDNVRLAKFMDVECKLNYAMASGDQLEPYQLSKIYKLYLDVYDAKLMPWEFNTKQMVRRLTAGNTVCPQSRECDSNIRCLQPDGDYYSCGSFGDDKKYPINFFKEVFQGDLIKPLANNVDLISMHNDCLSCSMFAICNGCKKTISDHKQHNIVEQHCALMKQLAPRILEISNETIY